MKTSCRTMASGAVMTMKMMMVMVMVMMVMMAAAVSEAAAVPKESKNHRRRSEDGNLMVTFPLRVDPEAFVPPAHLRPLNNISISPWTYNVTHDDTLIPPLLSEARCSLHGCLDHSGQEDLKGNLRSRPILHQVLVLRRVRGPAAAGGEAVYNYRLETRLVAVGCTCVRSPVHVQH